MAASNITDLLAAHPQTGDVLLAISGVSKHFGGVRAVEDVSLSVERGKLMSIIGPNGAGKTSLLNMISGFYRPDSGSIVFDGKDITGARPSRVAALGIARTFQNIALFAGMTRARQHHARPPRADEGRGPVVLCLLGAGAARGGGASRPCRGADRVPRARRFAQAADQRARLRPAQAGGARPRAGARPQDIAARRADGRDEPGRKRGHGPLYPRREPAVGHDDRS